MENNINDYIEYLMRIAMKKCGNIDDAKDLIQETLLSALIFQKNKGVINNIKSWLISVLNKKYYDFLRRKYKNATVSINDEIEKADNNEVYEEIIKTEEAEAIRREIAFLTKIYREVVVRYYIRNESIEEIAKRLDIPKGTVKSRLSVSREKIKKGIEDMEKYTIKSFKPEKLYVSISGTEGLSGEPQVILDGDSIAQNILIIAYEKPLTIAEISGAIGIPAAYVEPIVEKLVYAQLMKYKGKTIYTDFIIFEQEDNTKYIEEEKEMIKKNFDIYWSALQNGLSEIRKLDFYYDLLPQVVSKLEFFMLIQFLSSALYVTGKKIYNWDDTRPERPNGGYWHAMGYRFHDDSVNDEFSKYSYAGARRNIWQNTLGVKEICLHVYDTPLEKQRYYNLKNGLTDSELPQMLYILDSEIEPSETGINLTYFANIPYLVECGVLRKEQNKTKVDIPVLSKEQYNSLLKIHYDVINSFTDKVHGIMKNYLSGKKKKIPPHINSVPLQFQYMKATSALMIIVYEAKERGLILVGVDYPCPPMVLIIDK